MQFIHMTCRFKIRSFNHEIYLSLNLIRIGESKFLLSVEFIKIGKRKKRY